MRTILICVGGGAATAGSFGISRLIAGPSEDLFVFVSMVAFVLTVGLVIASGVAAWQERRQQPRVFSHAPRRWAARGGRERCGSCNRPMTRVGSLWICLECDRVTV